jgi:hypothetical protein
MIVTKALKINQVRTLPEELTDLSLLVVTHIVDRFESLPD